MNISGFFLTASQGIRHNHDGTVETNYNTIGPSVSAPAADTAPTSVPGASGPGISGM